MGSGEQPDRWTPTRCRYNRGPADHQPYDLMHRASSEGSSWIDPALFSQGEAPWALEYSDLPQGLDLPAPVSDIRIRWEEKLKEGCGWIVDQGFLLWDIHSGRVDYWMDGDTLRIEPSLQVRTHDFTDVPYPTRN